MLSTKAWPGVIARAMLKESYVEQTNRLADIAKAGDWEDLFARLDSDPFFNVNQWRIGGDSWFTPLHQAALLGAPVEVTNTLIDRGAWRTLRNAEGARPIDIAKERGHKHLYDSLDVRDLSEREKKKYATWDRLLVDLITERTKELDPVKYRPVPTEIIALEPLENLYFAYPGMYGGFSIWNSQDSLLVQSWSRVVGGSGQAHVITESGCVLVDEGFV